MNLAEARKVIDDAWNTPPARVNWAVVSRAAETIARETGAAYIPGQTRAPAPDERGTPDGYNAGARRHSTDGAIPTRSTGPSRPRFRSPSELEPHELPDAPPPGWART